MAVSGHLQGLQGSVPDSTAEALGNGRPRSGTLTPSAAPAGSLLQAELASGSVHWPICCPAHSLLLPQILLGGVGWGVRSMGEGGSTSFTDLQNPAGTSTQDMEVHEGLIWQLVLAQSGPLRGRPTWHSPCLCPCLAGSPRSAVGHSSLCSCQQGCGNPRSTEAE